jgi:hypothetical protein
VGGLKEESTAFAGAGLLVELYRQAGVGAAADRGTSEKGRVLVVSYTQSMDKERPNTSLQPTAIPLALHSGG